MLRIPCFVPARLEVTGVGASLRFVEFKCTPMAFDIMRPRLVQAMSSPMRRSATLANAPSGAQGTGQHVQKAKSLSNKVADCESPAFYSPSLPCSLGQRGSNISNWRHGSKSLNGSFG